LFGAAHAFKVKEKKKNTVLPNVLSYPFASLVAYQATNPSLQVIKLAESCNTIPYHLMKILLSKSLNI